MKREIKERMIKEVMQNFDFEKAHAFMVINNDKFYKDGEEYQPTVEDVKKIARELLEDAFDTRQKYPDFFSTTRGCLTAVATDEDIELIYHPLTYIAFADN